MEFFISFTTYIYTTGRPQQGHQTNLARLLALSKHFLFTKGLMFFAQYSVEKIDVW